MQGRFHWTDDEVLDLRIARWLEIVEGMPGWLEADALERRRESALLGYQFYLANPFVEKRMSFREWLGMLGLEPQPPMGRVPAEKGAAAAQAIAKAEAILDAWADNPERWRVH